MVAVDPSILADIAGDPHPALREHAVRVAARLLSTASLVKLADDPGMNQEIVTPICYLPGNPSSRKIKADRAETGSQAQLQSPIGAPLPSDILPDRMPF